MPKKNTELDNVSFEDFLNFDEEKFRYYKKMGEIMKPNSGGLKDIYEWTFVKVKELQMMLSNGLIFKQIPQILSFVHGSEQEDFWQMKWHEVFRLNNHVIEQVEKVVEGEKVLMYEPDADQLEAGIERFAQFGFYGTINTLADGNVLLWPAIETTPYKIIFLKLRLEREISEYTKNKAAIEKRKKS